MRPIRAVLIMVIGFIVLFVPCALGQELPARAKCEGKYKNGGKPTPEELRHILNRHSQWLQDNTDENNRANLCEANLAAAQLPEVTLVGANFTRANLVKANLAGANLSGADLSDTTLAETDFSGATLTGANLSEAHTEDPWHHIAMLVEYGADCRGAGINLERADLTRATLRGARMLCANVNHIIMRDADLSGADLSWGDLTEAMLRGTNVSEVRLSYANLTDVQYEPKPGTLPNVATAASTRALWTLHYDASPEGLVELREAFKRSGFREQERQVTYAIKRTEASRAPVVESAINFVMFDFTSQYGMSPGRPLCIGGALILLFAPLYMFALWKKEGAGIWKVWSKDRLPREEGQDQPERLTQRGLGMVFFGLYFSVLSAFHLGWREINVGSWIARVQWHEYTLRGTGWIRTVAGFQSLISIYLIALSVLTYFGRPFE